MSADDSQHRIESSLPKPWEEEQTFNDILYDWMSRAPWLAISAAAHLLVFFIIASIPWALLGGEPETEIQASLEQPPEEIFEEPPEELEEPEEEEPIEEPVLQDTEVVEEEVQDFEETEGDPNLLDAFDADQANDVIGIGGGASGKFGNRGRGRGRLVARAGKGVEQALVAGLQWLADHQDDDGKWDCDGFMKHDPPGKETDGAGSPLHDVGVTALALLAFLGQGDTPNSGQYQDVVSRGVNWLRDQQDPDTGLIGERNSHEFLYNHAIATLALCEAYYATESPIFRHVCQEAVHYIQGARNPYGAWRYEVPPNLENDTSVTGWMVFALKAAEEAGLEIDPEAYVGALDWIDSVTDTGTGRVGYNEYGAPSSRSISNGHYPTSKTEAMTAVGLLCRFFLGQSPEEEPIMYQHAELMSKTPPVWDVDPDAPGCDMYYWYYGTYAMYQISELSRGTKYWNAWEESMKPTMLDNQRDDESFAGSWDPVGPWGYSGGRVYSTALMVLCIEVYFRYPNILGAR